MDISVNIHYFQLNFSVCNQNILLEGSVSQNCYLGPSFYFMSKNVFFGDCLSLSISTFHKIKTRT